MKKNFRKIPTSILQKIEEFENDFIVATVLNLTEADLEKPLFSDLNFKIEEGQISYTTEFVPNSLKGTYSRRNIDGYRIYLPNSPKIYKRYYAGERAIFGDFLKGTFSLYIPRMVRAYENIAPKEISLLVELLETRLENNIIHYIVKISTSQVLNRKIANFDNELFFNVNLLQENIGSVDVYNSSTTFDEFVRTLHVEWELLPPGEADEDLNRITRNLRNITQQRLHEISDRSRFLREQNPLYNIYGKSGMLRYFGAKFSENLVVFENADYGNALYILFENWEELSRLSRLEIQTRPSDQYIRVRHTGNWKKKVADIILAKRDFVPLDGNEGGA